MKRKTFYLVFSENPEAVDIVREDSIVSRKEDDPDKVKFKYEIKKEKFIEVDGKVLREGPKTHLSKLFCDKSGNFINNKGGSVGTRKQELEKLRLQEARAFQINLQDIAQELHEDGADTLAENLPEVNRLPKKRSAQEMEVLNEAARNLDCFVSHRLKSRLVDSEDIFVDTKDLNLLIIQHGRTPKNFLKQLLRLLLPDTFLALDGISAGGKRGCVKIPETIIKTAAGYTTSIYEKTYKQEHGNDAAVPVFNFDIAGMLRNLVSNAKPAHKNYKQRRTEPQPPTTPTPPHPHQHQNQIHTTPNNSLTHHTPTHTPTPHSSHKSSKPHSSDHHTPITPSSIPNSPNDPESPTHSRQYFTSFPSSSTPLTPDHSYVSFGGDNSHQNKSIQFKDF